MAGRWVATYAYSPTDESHLTFNAGDIILVEDATGALQEGGGGRVVVCASLSTHLFVCCHVKLRGVG
jgi:hypothetical protein